MAAVGAHGFLEGGVGVGTEHLGPFVAVVARGIAAGEDVAEAVRNARERGHGQHGHFGAHLFSQGLDVGGGVVLGMQQHVEQREFDLAQRLQAALVVARGGHLVEQRARQGLAGVGVRGHLLQHVPFPAEVLHELAGQLHGVPFHAADAGDVALIDLREQMVQAVAELVEHGDDVVVGEQGGLVALGRSEVAHQMRHRRLQGAGVGPAPAGAHVVHPGAAALAVARRRVEVELADELAAALDAEEAHVRVPGGGMVLADGHFEQALDQFKQPLQHARRGEVLLELLFAEGIARFLEPLADEGPVPGLRVAQVQVLGRERAHFGEVALGIRAGAPREVAQETHHLLGRLRHLGHQRQGRVVRVAEQPGLLLTQREQFADDLGVVEASRIALGLVGRAGDVGAVQPLAHRAVARELHHRQVARRLEGELAALQPVGLRGVAGGAHHVVGHAVEFGLADHPGPGVGGVHRVLAELLAQRGHALLDLREALALSPLQLGAAEHEAAQRIAQRLLLRGVQARGVDGLVLGVEPLVGAQARPELGHRGQGGVVGRAQFGRVGHGVEVAHRAPGAAQALGGHVQRARHGRPVGRKIGRGDAL